VLPSAAAATPPAEEAPRSRSEADGGAWLRPWYVPALHGLEILADPVVEAALQLEAPQRALSYTSIASMQRVCSHTTRAREARGVRVQHAPTAEGSQCTDAQPLARPCSLTRAR
jgi:hypothetical protein